MKLVCIARFAPDGDCMDPVADSEASIQGQVAIKEGCRTRLCPDDAAALGFALDLRKQVPDLSILLIAQAPLAAISDIEDALRLGVDKALVLPTGLMTAGDIITNAKRIGRCLDLVDYDWILTGSDAHGPEAAPLAPALAGILGIDHLSSLCRVDETKFQKHTVEVERREGRFLTRYAVRGPAILGFDVHADYAMPYIRIKDRARNVSDRLHCLDDSGNEGDWFCERAMAHQTDAATRLTRLVRRPARSVSPQVVDLNDDGIEPVYRFLKQKRLI